MDHAYIEEHNIVARYEMRKLPAAECVGFEEHFVDCPECLKQLSIAQDFRRSLRMATAEDMNLEPRRSALLTNSRAWRWSLLGAAASIALLAVPSTLLVLQTRHLNSELSRANNASEAWRHRYEREQQTKAELQKQLTTDGMTTQNSSGADETKPKLPVLASIFPLNTVRSGDLSDSEPANLVVISGDPHWVVLLLDLDGQRFENYRVALTQPSGQELWKTSHLKPTPSNTLGITLPSRFFHQGDYLLTLEGLTRHGAYSVAGRYSFRVKLKQ